MAGASQTNYRGATVKGRSFVGPSPRTGSTQWGGGVLYVDLTDAMSRLSVALKTYSQEVQDRALYNAINKLGSKLLTAVRRDLVRTTGAKYGRVMRAVWADKAHPNRLFFRIIAKDSAMKLSDFGTPGKGGVAGRNPKNNAWAHSRAYKNAFTVKIGGQWEIVKRTSSGAGSMRRKGGSQVRAGSVKILYGPIIPKEMIKPGNPSTQHIAQAIPQQLEPVLMHELAQAVSRAKAASGT
jgi:hypothetical protein